MITKMKPIHRKTLDLKAKIYEVLEELGEYQSQSSEDLVIVCGAMTGLFEALDKLDDVDKVV